MALKKVETAKTVKTAAPAKEVKAEVVKTATVKAESVKTEPVKAEPAKAASKEEAPKKAPAKKAPVKKATVKKTDNEKTCNFYIQYAGDQFSYEDIIARSKEAAAADMGKRVSSVKTIDIYCKPEERAAYYVANGKIAGRIDL